MFCPKCKDECREGFTFCSACNVSLVDKLPEEKSMPVNEEDYEMILVYNLSGHGYGDAKWIRGLIISIFESENIPYVLNGDNKNCRGMFLVPKKYADVAIELTKNIK